MEAAIFARNQKIKSSSQKSILTSLGLRANLDNVAYPSISCLSDDTGLNRKTIISSLKSLAKDGYITANGDKKGITKQVIVWKINIDRNRNSSDEGTVPDSVENKSDLSDKAPQIRDTESTGYLHKKTSRTDALKAIKTAKNILSGWWKSEAGINAKGKEVGLNPNIGETMNSYKDRIFKAIKL